MKIKNSPVLFDYPNPRSNAFLMMRFQDTPQHADIHRSLKDSFAYYGINLLRADDKSYADSLWANICAYIEACSMGVAVFEQIHSDDFNPNVSIELGYMMALRKPVLLLKEKHLKSMPTDVVAQLYKPFDSYNIYESAQKSIFEWLKDIGVAKGEAERLVLFVSHGGTCRCAMAKVILLRALSKRQLPFRLRVESVAYHFGGTNFASNNARRVVYEVYGDDLLADHRVLRRSPGLIGEADLILVMSSDLKEGFPEEKTFNFNEFFGFQGDVVNPWPDDQDDEGKIRYRQCCSYFKNILAQNYMQIIEYLSKV